MNKRHHQLSLFKSQYVYSLSFYFDPASTLKPMLADLLGLNKFKCRCRHWDMIFWIKWTRKKVYKADIIYWVKNCKKNTCYNDKNHTKGKKK